MRSHRKYNVARTLFTFEYRHILGRARHLKKLQTVKLFDGHVDLDALLLTLYVIWTLSNRPN